VRLKRRKKNKKKFGAYIYMYVYLHIPNHQKTHTMKNHKFYTVQISSDFTTVAANLFHDMENDPKFCPFQMTENFYAFYSIREMAYFFTCLMMVYNVPQSAFFIDATYIPIPEELA